MFSFSKIKLGNLDYERQRFIVAHIYLVSLLNQRMFSDFGADFLKFQESLVQQVRDKIDSVTLEEIQAIIASIDDAFYNDRYPLVFSLEENDEHESISNDIDVSYSNHFLLSGSVSASCTES